MFGLADQFGHAGRLPGGSGEFLDQGFQRRTQLVLRLPDRGGIGDLGLDGGAERGDGARELQVTHTSPTAFPPNRPELRDLPVLHGRRRRRNICG